MTELRHQHSDLIRAVQGLGRLSQRWLTDLRQTCTSSEPRFVEALERWQEQLTHLKLHLHRAEARLRHYLLVPASHRPWREFPALRGDRIAQHREWQQIIVPYFDSLRLDGTYLRTASVLALDGEPTPSDIRTDLVALAAVASQAAVAIEHFLTLPRGEQDCLEDLAFYHVVSPWRTEGTPALLDVQRWLSEFLRERDEL